MFTGIVSARGQVIERAARGADARLRIEWPEPVPGLLRAGDSVAVAGVCLTALDVTDQAFAADLSAETLQRTTLGRVRTGDRVNLEPALKAGDRLGGHFVTGHVDGLARLQTRIAGDGSEVFEFTVPAALVGYLAPKGSITADGVSLTVNQVDGQAFKVTLIPHTLAVTTLGQLAPGDTVNIEMDLLARYLERLLQARRED